MKNDHKTMFITNNGRDCMMRISDGTSSNLDKIGIVRLYKLNHYYPVCHDIPVTLGCLSLAHD